MSSFNNTSKATDRSVVDETTALLAPTGVESTVATNAEGFIAKNIAEQQDKDIDDDDDDTPLPMGQLLPLCYVRIVEPIAFFSIFPFVAQMIMHCGVENEADIGFYSGLIESLFSLTQMLTMLPWGWLADRYGRKPMILFRCLAGVFSGSVVAARSMISEISTKKTQARAFSYFSAASNVGIMFGPFVGGVLSTPAEQYPGTFGNVQFFIDYPYALANIVAGAISLTAMLVTVFFVKETLTGVKEGAKPPKSMSTWELVSSPGVAVVLFLYSFCAFLGMAYTAVLTVFWYTKPSLGGYGFTPLMISIFLGIGGGAQTLWTLFVFPWMHKRFGNIGTLRYAWNSWPVVFAFSILGNYLLRWGQDLIFWVFISAFWFWACSIAIGYTGSQLILNDIAPSHNTLGTLNALAMTVTSGIRAIVPALFSSEFAAGVKYHILGGHLAMVTLGVLSILLRIALEWLPDKARGLPKKPTQDEEESAHG
ncbi:hypothetical protein MBLNU457_5524t1 [Dothideomycetes sp. NU457]